MVILLVVISGYSINGYSWSPILLMVISNYFIGGYWRLFWS